ncbi:MAG TPA: 30S ribosomal protein S5 [Candidatus Kapabacteria bacterium]|nr:30S ribosomal protein S5 [Candidatus Kapabacteria bacterium]
MAPERGRGRKPFKKEKPEFDQSIIDLARVTRVTKGGKQMSFRACVVLGDRNGRVGFGLAKGKDVQMAVEKAVNQGKKRMIRVPIRKETIPHRVEAKYKSGHIMLKPAPKGSGVIAGSAVRTVLELAGIPNISSKILGNTKNKVTNVKVTFEALQMFKARAYTQNQAPKPQQTAATPEKAEKKVMPKKRTPKVEKETPSATA